MFLHVVLFQLLWSVETFSEKTQETTIRGFKTVNLFVNPCLTTVASPTQTCIITCQAALGLSSFYPNSYSLPSDVFNRSHEGNCSDALQLVGVPSQTKFNLSRLVFPKPSQRGFEEIYITGSCIESLEAAFFPHILGMNSHRLLVVTLAKNTCLRILPTRAFSGLSQLKTLDLEGNGLEFLDPEPFFNLPSLQSLLLSHNRLTTIGDRVFLSGLPNLRYMDLSFNRLSSLSASPFSALLSLESLRLNGNQLQFLQPGVFASLALRTLNLSCNSLVKFQSTMVAGTTRESLRNLYLSHNQLQTLQEDVVDFQNANPDYVDIHLEGNQWHCDCKLAWMKQRTNFILTNTIRCQSPVSLQNRTLNSLMEHSFCDSDNQMDYDISDPINWSGGASENDHKSTSFPIFLTSGRRKVHMWLIMVLCVAGVVLVMAALGGYCVFLRHVRIRWFGVEDDECEDNSSEQCNENGGLLSRGHPEQHRSACWFSFHKRYNSHFIVCPSYWRRMWFCLGLCPTQRKKSDVTPYVEGCKQQQCSQDADRLFQVRCLGANYAEEETTTFQNHRLNTTDDIPLHDQSKAALIC